MYLTEEEAKTKWCPHTWDDERREAKCIASGCTQWRWECSPQNVDMAEYGQKPTGYCGLAGPVKE